MCFQLWGSRQEEENERKKDEVIGVRGEMGIWMGSENGLGKKVGEGGKSKMGRPLGRERVSFYLKKMINMAPPPNTYSLKIIGFPHSPWSPPLRFLTPWEGVPPSFGSTWLGNRLASQTPNPS